MTKPKPGNPAPGFTRRTPPIEVRFWKKVRKGPDCWIWQASVSGDGYGQLGSGTKPHTMVKAHRVSWEIHFGPIPEGASVLHRCDVRTCVNPQHLFVGSQKDNMQDMKMKNRHLAGERNAKAKLTDVQARSIRRRRIAGERGCDLAKEFGVSQATVCRIAHGLRY